MPEFLTPSEPTGQQPPPFSPQPLYPQPPAPPYVQPYVQPYVHQPYGQQPYRHHQSVGSVLAGRRSSAVPVVLGVVVALAAAALGGWLLLRPSTHSTASVAPVGVTTAPETAPTFPPTVTPPAPAPPARYVYRSRAAHLTARFVHHPVLGRTTETVQGAHISAITVGDPVAHLVAQAGTYSPPVPAGETGALLVGLLRGASLSRVDVATPVPTTFRGHEAMREVFTTRTGLRLEVMAVLYSPTRTYLLVAPDGSAFTSFVRSFRMIR